MYNPSPLSDAELSQKIRVENDDIAMRELITRHSGVYHNSTKPFLNNPNFSYKESIDEKPYTIYSAALGYDPVKGAFGSFLGTVTRNRCLQIINEKKKNTDYEEWGEVCLDSVQSPERPLDKVIEARDGIEEVMKVVGKMGAKKKRIFSKRYLTHSDNSMLGKWDKIAKSENQSKWGCILSTRSCERKIRERVGMELVGRTY
jgi:DNA-directed RNA polymerase specialized sigma24 family protein